MTISERKLEEDEVKIDNILHKILKANERIRDLNLALLPAVNADPTDFKTVKEINKRINFYKKWNEFQGY